MKLRFGIILLTLSGPALAALHVQVTSPRGVPSSICTFSGDEKRLLVFEDNRLLFVHRFCSAYGKAAARIVVDANQRPYIILRHAVGHGSHASSDFFTIYSINKRLVARGTLIAREPIGTFADANYDYSIRTPPSGGLELVGSLKVTGQSSALDVAPEPPPRLKIDVR